MTAVAEPPVLVEDASVWPAITSLVSCLCRQLELDGLPPVCICSPLPGETYALDYVTEDAGMAWVRLEAAWPSTNFPNPTQAARCDAALAFSLEVGVAYCAPILQDDGSPPDLAAQFEATRLQLAAMSSMRRAIRCCFPVSNLDVVLSGYAPLGPDGAAVGGVWTLWVAEGVVR